jgi:hypothetical protein
MFHTMALGALMVGRLRTVPMDDLLFTAKALGMTFGDWEPVDLRCRFRIADSRWPI